MPADYLGARRPQTGANEPLGACSHEFDGEGGNEDSARVVELGTLFTARAASSSLSFRPMADALPSYDELPDGASWARVAGQRGVRHAQPADARARRGRGGARADRRHVRPQLGHGAARSPAVRPRRVRARDRRRHDAPRRRAPPLEHAVVVAMGRVAPRVPSDARQLRRPARRRTRHPLLGRSAASSDAACSLDIGRWREANGTPLRLDRNDPIETDELDACLADQGVALEPGDVMLLRTGWIEWYEAMTPDERATYAQDYCRRPASVPGASDGGVAVEQAHRGPRRGQPGGRSDAARSPS